MVFPRLKRIIQVQGCFWHQHTGCPLAHIPKSRIEYWRPKLKTNQERDRNHMKKLRAAGWDVLTIWECEVKGPTPLTERINAFLSGSTDILPKGL